LSCYVSGRTYDVGRGVEKFRDARICGVQPYETPLPGLSFCFWKATINTPARGRLLPIMASVI
jgi:hypothetical protein